MLEAYLNFLQSLSSAEFLRLFWFYFFLEMPRYVFLDVCALVLYTLDRLTNRSANREARRQLFLERPLISVIVPGKDEGENYYQLARTLGEQTYTHFELIVVDDGSEDNSMLIGKTLEKSGDIDVFLRNEVRGGKASAANLALRYARGEYILHLDADTSLDRDALERMLLPFYLDERIGAVGGSLGVRNRADNLCTTLQGIEYYMTISVGRMAASTLGILRIVSGALGAFRRDVLDQVQGWDIGPGLDGDLTVKIRKAGYRIGFAVDAVGLTDGPRSFVKLARQRLRWQRSLIRFRMRKHVNVFLPNEAFSLRTFISFLENIFYNVVLTVLWFVYWYDAITHFTDYILFILVTNFLLYSASKTVEMVIVVIISKHKKSKLPLFFYVPLMVIYTGYYLRLVRAAAYFTEFFFMASYKDSWNPLKTSRVAEENRF